MKKKGFTLIELIAVIIILGIVIAVMFPVVDGVISKSEKNTLKSSVNNIVRVVSQKCNEEKMNGEEITTNYKIENYTIDNEDIEITNLPQEGSISVSENCSVKVSIVEGDYCVLKSGNNVTINNNIYHCGTQYVDVPETEESCFIFDETTHTITGYNYTNESCPTEISIPATIDNVPVEHIGDLAFYTVKYDALLYSGGSIDGPIFEGIVKENILKYPDLPDYYVAPVNYLVEEPKMTCVLADGTEVELDIDYVFTDEDVSKYIGCFVNSKHIAYPSDAGVITKVNFAPATNLKTIGISAFLHNKITEVIFKNNSNLSSIGLTAFAGNLISGVLDLSNSKLTTVGGFGGNSITKVILPNTTTTLLDGAFYRNLIDEVVFGSNITTIGLSAFSDNLLSGNMVLPETITNIDAYSFENNNIEFLEINENLKEIPVRAFNSNPTLKSVTFGSNVENIGYSAFGNAAIETLEFNEKLKTIGEEAFYANNLSSITFNDNLESIGPHAFAENTSTIDTLVLPDKLTVIDYSTFNKTKINNLTVGDNITEIKDYAFSNCSMQNITWGSSLKTIGEEAFYANDLSSITFNDNLESIGASAFYANNLSSVTFNDNLESIGAKAFAKNTSTIETLVLPDKLTVIEDSTFAATKINNLTVGDNITEIKDYAFSNCSMQNITWGSSLKTIGKGGFQYNSFKTFNVPEGIEYLGGGAFMYSHQYIDDEEVTLPNSLVNISFSSFYGIRGHNLKKINIGSNLKYASSNSFYCVWGETLCGYTIYIDQIESESNFRGYGPIGGWGNAYVKIVFKDSSIES